MADIQKLTYPYFTDGTTQLNAANLNPIIAKINEVIDKVNGGVTPTPSSYEAETTAILGRYTKNVSTAQKDALNAFVVSLKNAGIYSKIDYLVLPFLATNAAEAMQNALGDTGTLTGDSSITLANNAVKPIIGESLCKISLPFDVTDAHLSAYNVDSASPTKWDVALSDGNFNGIGKRINALSPGMYYVDTNSSNQRYTPNDYAGEDTTAKSYLIGTSKSGNVALCYNGDYETQSGTIKANASETSNIIFGQAAGIGGSSPYVDPTEGSTSFGGATLFSYGLLSVGKGLTQTECTALNTAVTTLMNVIFS